MQEREIVAAIEGMIAAKGFVPGDQLPAEEELAQQLGLTRHYTRRGLAALRKSGRLIQRRGAGTFIASPRETPKLEKEFVLIGPFTPASMEDLAAFHQSAFEYEHEVRLVNTGPVAQDPAYERACLKRLQERPPVGVIIEPTPYAPSSFDLYEPLRQLGTKVAILNCPVDQALHHAFFHLDYRKAGYLASIQLGMQGWKRQHLVSAQTLDEQWHFGEFTNGVREAARDFSVDLRITLARAHLNRRSCRVEWEPDSEPVTLEDEVGYICSKPGSAQFLNNQLRAAGHEHFGMIAGSRRRVDQGFDTVLLDPVERYRRIFEYFINPAISATDKVHEVIQPVLCQHQENPHEQRTRK